MGKALKKDLDHVHQWRRVKPTPNSTVVRYFCTYPDCMATVNRNVLYGKRSICHSCGKEFILDWDSLRRVKPKCKACYNSPQGQKRRRVEQTAEDFATRLTKELLV